jgi:hypothetical protein
MRAALERLGSISIDVHCQLDTSAQSVIPQSGNQPMVPASREGVVVGVCRGPLMKHRWTTAKDHMATLDGKTLDGKIYKRFEGENHLFLVPIEIFEGWSEPALDRVHGWHMVEWPSWEQAAVAEQAHGPVM